MKNSKIPILLSLMMLITPLASAFDHCSGMDMAGHLSESLHLTDAVSLKDVNQKDMHSSDNTNPIVLDCHTSQSCAFHACGGYGITSSVTSVNTVIALHYSYFEYFSPTSTDLSPNLRPPILIL